ncbi:MAG: DUF2029 domain-containing protein [Chloroflexi bacterium]|nr:DUF2029 domain-containing protein [Chloroflexota bacterium]
MKYLLSKWSEDQLKLGLFAVVMVVLFMAIAVTLNQIPLMRLKSDIFLRWYATGKLFSEGRDLYDVQNSVEVDNIVYGQDSGLASGFYYPAQMLLFTAPLSILPYRTAHIIWTISVQLFYFIAIWVVSAYINWPARLNQRILFLMAVVLSIPSLQHTIWGQFNTIGILALALSYIALRKYKLVLSGILATGLTFKPHVSILTLLFLLIWAICKKARWSFLTGAAVGGIFVWLLAEIMQPKWLFSFFSSLGRYIPVKSVVDMIWNPYQVVSIFLVAGSLLIFLRNRNTDVNSPEFTGGFVLSMSVWALVIPIVGMFHVMVLPIGIILLASYYRQQ